MWVAFSKNDLILCTLPLVWRASLFLQNVCTNYYIFLIFNFWNCPAVISKLYWWFSSFLSRLFQTRWFKRTNPYKNYVRSLCFWKRAEKRPTTKTAMSDLCRSYVIKKQIGTTRKGSDIQLLSLRLNRPINEVLSVASHHGKILHLHLGWQTIIYCYHCWSTSSTRKVGFRLRSVAHVLFLGSEK